MASTDCAIKEEQDYEEEEEEDGKGATITFAIQRLLKQVQCERQAHVKMRMDTNRERLKGFTENLSRLDSERKGVEGDEPSGLFLLCMKSQQVLGNLNGPDCSGEKDGKSGTQESSGIEKPMAIIFGSQTGGKTAVRPVKLRKIENVPPYTTWIYLDRNQRMTEDQSVVGRRRIYYDSDGNETLIASDSEEEDPGDDDDREESKYDFTKGEDSLIWMVIQELGLEPAVLDELSDLIDIKREEIEARYDSLLKESVKNVETGLQLTKVAGTSSAGLQLTKVAGASSTGLQLTKVVGASSTGLQLTKVAGTSNTGKVPPLGKRKFSTKEIAGAAAKEAKEAVKGALKDLEKEVLDEESAVQALPVTEVACAPAATLEEAKVEPKDLLTAMDSFDNLFCRRCLVFDCRLHGCSQAIVHPSERQQPWSGTEEPVSTPCGKHCYRLLQPSGERETGKASEISPAGDTESAEKEPSASPEQDQELTLTQEDEVGASQRKSKRAKISNGERSCSSETPALASFLIEETTTSLHLVGTRATAAEQTTVVTKEKLEKRISATRKSLSRRVKRPGPRGESSGFLKPQLSQEESIVSPEGENQDPLKDEEAAFKEEGSSNSEKAVKLRGVGRSKLSGKRSRVTKEDDIEGRDQPEGETLPESEAADVKGDLVLVPEVLDSKEGLEDAEAAGDTAKMKVGVGWSELEMGLYEKGLQIFGRNSCLIARNLLQGFKTCAEVARYTEEQDTAGQGPDGVRRLADSLDIEAASRARLYGGRRKGRVRKLKYTWKSVVHPLIRKRLTNGKDQPCRQYTPCNCLYTCGKQCPCLLNGTCCEKYCGCSKTCKNRFRGCHCAKSQCCSRQCPCFAAGRECDPDVCRNCWVGCGDGSLGGPPPRGDNYECHNMKLMLKQQQRVLLGRSDVAGWGAFLKNPVSKHEYLGEYTGELISHREADKRGKIYDRENSSFLFNLNDQYVLDACRKGDKLKFANHSPQPNCYAKVIMVSGDHRVGIFAKERITAGEELFYDYRYEPDRAPVWAKKPDDPNHKRDDLPSTSGRAQKAA